MSIDIKKLADAMPGKPKLIEIYNEKGEVVAVRADEDYGNRLWSIIKEAKNAEAQAKIDAQKIEQAKRKAIWLEKQGK